MVKTEDLRKQHICITNRNTDEELLNYSGGAYIYYNDQEEKGFFHFVDEDGKHHRVYGDYNVVINEV